MARKQRLRGDGAPRRPRSAGTAVAPRSCAPRSPCATISLYGRSGYHATSVKAVCEAAGLTERYFSSFANGESLLQACFLQVTQHRQARMRQAAQAERGTPMARVSAGLSVYFTELRSNPAAARVFLIEMGSVSAATEAVVREGGATIAARGDCVPPGEDGHIAHIGR